MHSVRHCSKPREIVVSSIPDGSLLGDGSGQPVFEGFSDSQADRNRIRVNHRISVLQAAKRGLLGRLTSLCHLVPGVSFVFALSNFVFESVGILSTSRSRWCGPTTFVPTYSGGRTRATFFQGCRSLSLIRIITSGPTRQIRVGAPMSATSLSPAGGRRRRSVC